jgi:hypothetical protein
MRLCAYELCSYGPGGTQAVIPDDADERKRFCLSKHRTAQHKLEHARPPKPKRPGAPQISFMRAVKACEKALGDCITLGAPTEGHISRLAREYMLDALPAKQRERLEAGR